MAKLYPTALTAALHMVSPQSSDSDPTCVSQPLSEQRDLLSGVVLKRDREDLQKDVQMLRSNPQFLQR